ncbi:hypothetical protein ACT7DH_09040 [Bacillus pacificus]
MTVQERSFFLFVVEKENGEMKKEKAVVVFSGGQEIVRHVYFGQ